MQTCEKHNVAKNIMMGICFFMFGFFGLTYGKITIKFVFLLL